MLRPHLTPAADRVGVAAHPLSPPAALVEEAERSEGFRQILATVRRRRWLAGISAASVMLLCVAWTIRQRLVSPVYEGSFMLLISDPINAEMGSSGSEALAAAAFSQTALNRSTIDLPTLVELLKSPMLLEPVARRFQLTTGELAEKITIEIGGDKLRDPAEGVLRVSLRGQDPKQDQPLIEDLARTYLEAALRQRQERIREGIRFLDGQAPSLQRQSGQIQEQMAAFRERYGVLDPVAEGAGLKQQQVSQLSTIASLESERLRLLKARQAVQAGRLNARTFQETIGGGGGGGSSSSGGSSGGSSGSAGSSSSGRESGGGGLELTGVRESQLQELVKLDEQLADARSKYTPSSGVVKSLEARRRQLAPRLQSDQLEAVDAALSLNATRLDGARRQGGQISTKLALQPALIKQYQALDQKLTLAQQNLASFNQTRDQFRLEAAQNTVPWKLIAPPRVGKEPVEPSIPSNLAKGLLLALAAGTGAALLRDRLDPVFHRSEEVRESLGLPVLGHIPHVRQFRGVREKQRFLLQEIDQPGSQDNRRRSAERFFYQEAFRNLYTSLRFLGSDKPLRSIVLTSTVPSEGKSLVNVLLAKTLAEMGQRVLLVDADLRKPQVHVRLGLNNITGFSNLLTDEEINIADALQTMPDYPSWKVLTAGRVPPDPTRLLSSGRLERLMRELEESSQFDLILYDTPPVLGLSDAALMAQHCDGLVLLVSLNGVARQMPREAMQRIRSSGASLLGVVTNALKPEQGSASAYAHAAYAYYMPNETAATAHQGPGSRGQISWSERIQERVAERLKWKRR